MIHSPGDAIAGDRQSSEPDTGTSVAIIGLSGRFPGAANIDAFWANLCSGVDSISRFDQHDLEDSFDAETRSRPDFVRARSVLAGIEDFDADFFGMVPADAALTDPQQRVFLECCWEALESAGYDPAAYRKSIGVYAGCSLNTYLWRNVLGDQAGVQRFCSDFQVNSYAELVGALPDFLATRVCYKLDLKGPGVAVHSACSTSLLAVAQACQALLNAQCDMVLAGGVSITLPQRRGYLPTDGGIVSPDGTCRPFDARANGTVFGSGAGVVLLKRLEYAIRDGDHIHAVIRGFGVNNDGAGKVGFAAPSVGGQAAAILQAQAMAGVSADRIGLVEAHGTGTPLGDPIEFAGLVEAFRRTTKATGYCALGSVKANIGHVDAAAGVVALIKTVLSLERELIPPLTHFSAPNPHLDVASSPFKFLSEPTPWQRGARPRLAGVSALGVGGTNVHVIVEESPALRPAADDGVPVLLPLSARTPAALAAMRKQLAAHLREKSEANLADIAFTLQSGRRAFQHRFAVVAESRSEAIKALESQASVAHAVPHKTPRIAFMFPGQGSQYAGMGGELFRTEPVFRDAVLECARHLEPVLGRNLAAALYAAESGTQIASEINETALAQPAIFVVEYALARLWQSWGLRPQVMVGHSVGEFVAACLAGVMRLEDALRLIALRGRLMQALPKGAMLSVRLPADELRARLPDDVTVAVINAPALCVVAGPIPSVEKLEQTLVADGTVCRLLPTSHAFHSAMMDPAVPAFLMEVERIALSVPSIPIVSSVTGLPLSDAQARDPSYWARHLREPVNFSAAARHLRAADGLALLEIGPGATLATLVRQQASSDARQIVVSSMPPLGGGGSETVSVRAAVAVLWQAGVPFDWAAFNARDANARRRVPLPTYPFERKRHWIEAPRALVQSAHALQSSDRPAIAISAVVPAAVLSSTMSSDVSSAEPTKPAGEELMPRICGVFEKVSGLSLAGGDPDRSFIDLGFDSLLLTQATRALQSEFGVKIAFRQLMGAQGTLATLAAFIAERAPKPALPVADAPATSAALAPVSTSNGSMAPVPTAAAPAIMTQYAVPAALGACDSVVDGQTTVERVMRSQMELMNQVFSRQLDTLAGIGSGASRAAIDTSSATKESSLTAPASSPVAAAAPLLKVEAEPSPARSPAATSTAATSFGPFKGLQARNSDELSAHQKLHFAQLLDRVQKRAPRTKQATQATRGVLADPRVVAGFRDIWKEIVFPVLVNRSKGARLWDVDGNEYIDLLNGFGPIMFGHRPAFVEDALREQLGEGLEIGPQTPLAGEIATMFCDITGNERMTFCNTGSEAVMAAFRVARTVTGRDKIVTFTGAYHGMFDEVLISTGRKAGEPGALPIAPGIPAESVANMVVLEHGADASLDWIRAHANELAAVIVEPVQSRRPQLQPVAFLKALREITAGSGTALIFDEVVTGFRAHPGGCQALFGIRADMATYGKVLGGGMPIGVLAGRAEYLDALDGGQWQYGDASVPEVGVTFFAGTFVRHPLTLAAVRAILKEIKAQGPALQERLSERTAAMVARINEALKRWGVPTELHSFRSVFYFKFPVEERLASLFYVMLREKGIHVLEGFPCFMTTAHSDADIDTIVAAFEYAARGMREAHFFVKPMPIEIAPALQLAAEHAPAVSGPSIVVPITEAQREIFLAAMIDDDASLAFNESFTVHLEGALEVSILRGALAEMVARHEALRAVVDAEGAHLIIDPQARYDFTERDLSELGEDERRVAYEQLVATESATPFDLQRGPLLRVRLIKRSASLHSLVFCAHHIVCDGWSTNVMIGELAKLYTSGVEGRPADLKPAVRFTEYCMQRSAAQASLEGSETAAFWLERFADKPAPVDLPTDRPRGSSRTNSGATLRYEIGNVLTKRCRELAAREKASLFIVLFAGFNALVARLTKASDITVAVPMAAQAHLDNGNLVGHCVDFLPLRSKVDSAASFSALVAEVRNAVFDAYEHQSYTYGTLVRSLDMKRDPARLPLTELQFNVEQLGSGEAFKHLAVRAESNGKAAVNSDIFVNVIDGGDGLSITCDYNTDLYDEATIARWMKGFEQLIEAATADATSSLADLHADVVAPAAAPVAASTEDLASIAEWNSTDADYPRDVCAFELFEQQAITTPDRIALTQGAQTLSYAELNRRANRLARRLVELGAQPGALVGICVDRTPEMIIALIAVMKTGAAYVPLDPTHPVDRIRFTMTDSGIAILVTQDSLSSKLPDTGASRLLIDRDAAAIAVKSDGNLSLEISPESPVYVIYTSGSTGRPKGVAVSHRALVNFLWSMKREPGLSAGDVLAAVTTITFDIAGLEIYLPLIVGACVDLVQPEVARDGGALAKHLAQRNITVMQATPATWRMLIDSGWAGDGKLRAFCGGEALPRSLAEPVRTRVGALWNLYGPTETTIWSTAERITGNEAVVTIGRPIANTKVHILDEHGHIVPIGAVGEIWIGGDGVAIGYHGRPELTAERFVAGKLGGAYCLYRTGDLGRWLENGRLEHLGRIDNQIKLRGFRVELGEIEATIDEVSGVEQTRLVADVDNSGSTRLVAFCVASSDVTPAMIIDHCASKLPEFMVPVSVVLVPRFPLTLNGKIDQSALLAIEKTQRQSRTRVEPETGDERTLAAIVAEVVRVDAIGVTDNLFEIGVDSLKIFQIASRASKAGVNLTPRSIMKGRTIRNALREAGTNPMPKEPVKFLITPVARDRYRVRRPAESAAVAGNGIEHGNKT